MSANISDQTNIAKKNMRIRFLPAWYLPNGTKTADENELDSASGSCERWSLCCGALVIIAVIAECIIAIVEPPYGLFLKLSVPADVAVAIGIVGEVMLGMWNNRLQTELRNRSNKRLSEAIERAAKAELETQRLKEQFSWREINEEQQRMMMAALKTRPGSSVMIWYFGTDPESHNLALDIGAIFRMSGWHTTFQNASYAGNFVFGIRISSSRGLSKDLEVIQEAFTNGFIDFEPIEVPRAYMHTPHDNVGFPYAAYCELYIGPKLPTALAAEAATKSVARE